MSVDVSSNINVKKERVGSIRTNKQGLKMECIGYRSATDLDVRFEKSGLVRKHCQWYNFDTGGISDTTVTYAKSSVNKLVGSIFRSSEGWDLRVEGGEDTHNIEVFCEKTRGYKVVQLRDLKNGLVSGKIKFKIGAEFLSIEGIRIRVIETPKTPGGRPASYITLLRLDNNEVIKNVRKTPILKGEFSINSVKTSFGLKFVSKEKKAGELISLSCGLKLEVQEYYATGLCDAKVINEGIPGTIFLYDLIYANLKKGQFPTKYRSYFEELVSSGVLPKNLVFAEDYLIAGEKGYANNGQMYRIKEINRKERKTIITVEFEDCTEYTFYEYRLKMGYINNPNFAVKRYDGALVVAKGSHVGCVNILKYVYSLLKDSDKLYICKCNKCGLKDILTPREMLFHKCNEGVVKVPQWVLEEQVALNS